MSPSPAWRLIFRVWCIVAEDDGFRPSGPMPWEGDTGLSGGVQFCGTVSSHQRARINSA